MRLSAFHYHHYHQHLLLLLLLLFLGSCESFSTLRQFPSPETRSTSLHNVGLASSFFPQPTVAVRQRNDCREPANWITNVDLDFSFSNDNSKPTRVTSVLTIAPNENHILDSNDLILNGDSNFLTLLSITTVNSISSSNNDEDDDDDDILLVEGKDYTIFPQNDTLVVASTRLNKKLKIVVDVECNTAELSGLFYNNNSNNNNTNNITMYCTHCEPSGFRQITYFADRPDNCAIFDSVRLEADQDSFPILLSNGNLIEAASVKDDPSRHYAIFNDPFPKPSYLFGLVVVANMKCIRDSYTTTISGNNVDLVIYGERDQLPKLRFAMDTLKNAMKWEEDTYGLEYDLDTYTIVAAQHFTIGAMENKGLNLFMTSLIATDPSCTTDITYDLVEKTIAHEYFHNWSGNRVTIRDWFEFTLKEGLTVYRDQEFTSDVGLKTATRIETVKILREKQFAEDASPARQAIRPESYASSKDSLDSLATSTTYHKGAEVCRMLKTILTKSGFRKGLNLYMIRHDGTGATCDDFLKAMADANPNVDLSQFGLWYSTAGTPVVSYDYRYDNNKNRLELSLSQKLSHTTDDGPLLHIPVAVGLLDKETGKEVLSTTILNLKERNQTFFFDHLPGDVVPSLLRDFSAPVYLVPSVAATSDNQGSNEQERLAFLAAYDTDGFNRWEAMQELFGQYILSLYEDNIENALTFESNVLTSFGRTLTDPDIDASSKSAMLSLPSESVLARRLQRRYDPVALLDARIRAINTIAKHYKEALKEVYDELTPTVLNDSDITSAKSRAIRSLRNRCLEYLCCSSCDNTAAAARLAKSHFETANCFTDQFLAFRQISSMANTMELRDDVTLQFYQLSRSSSESPSSKYTILNKWFQTQALSDLSDALPRVQALTQHPDFKANNAGRFRSLITTFTRNTRSFHTKEGYQFIGSIIRQMDRRSPTLSVELAKKLTLFSNYQAPYSTLMQEELIELQNDSSFTMSNELLLTVSMALIQDGGMGLAGIMAELPPIPDFGGIAAAAAATASASGTSSKSGTSSSMGIPPTPSQSTTSKKGNKKRKRSKPSGGKKGFS